MRYGPEDIDHVVIDAPEELTIKPRWKAVVTYNVFWQGGIKQEQESFFFEELHELHYLIENGENFHAIVDIVISHNG